MQKEFIFKVRDLTADERRVCERLMGETVGDDGSIRIKTYPAGSVIREAPTGEERVKAYQRLESSMNKITKGLEHVSDVELDSAIDEAVERVRHPD